MFSDPWIVEEEEEEVKKVCFKIQKRDRIYMYFKYWKVQWGILEWFGCPNGIDFFLVHDVREGMIVLCKCSSKISCDNAISRIQLLFKKFPNFRNCEHSIISVLCEHCIYIVRKSRERNQLFFAISTVTRKRSEKEKKRVKTAVKDNFQIKLFNWTPAVYIII